MTAGFESIVNGMSVVQISQDYKALLHKSTYVLDYGDTSAWYSPGWRQVEINVGGSLPFFAWRCNRPSLLFGMRQSMGNYIAKFLISDWMDLALVVYTFDDTKPPAVSGAGIEVYAADSTLVYSSLWPTMNIVAGPISQDLETDFDLLLATEGSGETYAALSLTLPRATEIIDGLDGTISRTRLAGAVSYNGSGEHRAISAALRSVILPGSGDNFISAPGSWAVIDVSFL